MPKLKAPIENELATLKRYLTHYKSAEKTQLLAKLPEIRRHYNNYQLYVDRDHKRLRPTSQLLKYKSTLEGAYTSGAIFQSYFTELRYSRVLLCLMCGIPRNGQLDHYLPTSNFPQFAVFRYNLLPVCGGCNSSKKNYDKYLHPIFSGWAITRYLTVNVTDFKNGTPRFSISTNRRLNLATRRKLQKFIMSAGVRKKILGFCEDYWHSYIDREITDEILVKENKIDNVDLSIAKLSSHLRQKSALEFMQNGCHSAAGMLYRAASFSPDLLRNVLERRLAAALEDNQSLVYRLYGVII
jgi:5-methylcytosine-specific restriction endonuclease McrA